MALTFEQVVAVYRTFDPSGWVGIYRSIPMGGGLILIALGTALLLFGGRLLFRVVAGPLAALAGVVWGAAVLQRLGVVIPGNPATVSWGLGGLFALIGFLSPAAAMFLAFGIPAGMVGGELAGSNDFLLGFVPTFLVCGAIAAGLSRFIGAIVSSICGAWLLVMGLLAALHQVGSLVSTVTRQPFGVLVAAGLFALAGSLFQLAARPSPEQAASLAAERERLKKQKADRAAVEKRWSGR